MIAFPSRALPRAAAAAAVLILLAGGCSGGSGQAQADDCSTGAASAGPTAESTSSALPSSTRQGCDSVTYLTSFGTLGRDAYPYVAQELGYFTDADLDVEIEPGVGIENLRLLAGDQAQFVAIDMSALTVTIGSGNAEYRAIAAIHQLAPQALMAVDPAIAGPQDLAGRSLALVDGAVGELLFPAYSEQAGLDPDQVIIEHTDPGQLPAQLAAGTVDAIDQFVFGRPLVQAAVGGREVTVLPYSDYLPELYGIVIVTTPTIADEQPELVERFVGALLRGLEHSLDHPDEAGQILASRFEEIDPAVAAAELQIMDSYSRIAGTPLGEVDDVRVARSIALLEAIGAIPAGMVARDIVDFDLVPTEEEEEEEEE